MAMKNDAPPEAPSRVVARRLRAVRKSKAWSQQDLARRLAELGAPTDRATLARTEAGDRGVSLDDTIMLAAALDVSPLALVLPDNEDTPVAVAPRYPYRAEYFRRWFCGLAPLPAFADVGAGGDMTEEEFDKQPLHTPEGKQWDRHALAERARFFESTLPLFGPWQGYSKPGVQHLLQMADSYASAAGDDNRRAMERFLNELSTEVERQRTRLQALGELSTPTEVRSFARRTGGEIDYRSQEED